MVQKATFSSGFWPRSASQQRKISFCSSDSQVAVGIQGVDLVIYVHVYIYIYVYVYVHVHVHVYVCVYVSM